MSAAGARDERVALDRLVSVLAEVGRARGVFALSASGVLDPAAALVELERAVDRIALAARGLPGSDLDE